MSEKDLQIGDTVYQTDGVRVYGLVIKNIIFDTSGIAFDRSAIGESVFLTQAEAEERLAKLNKEVKT